MVWVIKIKYFQKNKKKYKINLFEKNYFFTNILFKIKKY
jgi:hypothetical protein